MNRLQNFKITKLHDYKDYNLVSKDNTLILVGENGAGKTTILRILFYILSGQWNALSKYKFQAISIRIDNRTYSIKKSDLERKFDFTNRKILRHIPPHLKQRFSDIFEEYKGSNMPLSELELLCDRYDIPFHYVLNELQFSNGELFPDKTEKLNLRFREIKKAFGNTQILYLPTYRRIEQELSIIFKGINEDEIKHRKRLIYRQRKKENYTELIEFGMKDIERSISDTLEELKDFARESLNSLTLGYLGDVVDKKYSVVDVAQIKAADDDTIKNILDRIDDVILSQKSKKHLSETIDNVKRDGKLNEHAKVICHYFIKLLNFQQELEGKELNMRGFCEVCNRYMVDKTFEYTSSSFSFSILPKKNLNVNENITLDQLSSGEKQIVSLFNHLYLSEKSNYFVMIDEPELSLSVPWQRRFLVDINNSTFCTGIIAVTHSPFIYENDLENYAHGLGEFLTIREKK